MSESKEGVGVRVERGVRGERGEMIEAGWAMFSRAVCNCVVSLELSACWLLRVHGGMAVVIFRRVASLMISGGECGAVCENDWFGRYSSEKTVDVELSQENASQDVQC